MTEQLMLQRIYSLIQTYGFQKPNCFIEERPEFSAFIEKCLADRYADNKHLNFAWLVHLELDEIFYPTLLEPDFEPDLERIQQATKFVEWVTLMFEALFTPIEKKLMWENAVIDERDKYRPEDFDDLVLHRKQRRLQNHNANTIL